MAKYSNGTQDNLDIPESSVTVLESRYLSKDGDGNLIETGEDLFRRVAFDIAVGDSFYLEGLKEKINREMPTQGIYEICRDDERIKTRVKEFFDLLSKGYFLPNSPTLMNAGKKLQQLSACFVLPIADSMEDIFQTLKDMAMVHKSGGGTGFSFSRLRPNGAYIKSTGGYSPGPLSFLFSYNEAAGQITQGGKRRGANMGIIRANHPDAMCFAKVKGSEGVLSNFNLSIAFTNSEMQAITDDDYILMEDPREGKSYTVENAKKRSSQIYFGKGDSFETSWKVSEDETKIIDKYTDEEIGKVEEGRIFLRARSLFGIIVEGVWQKGEPGVIFIDNINNKNPTPEVGEIESTNPCGEQPLLPYESCNLGSIDLSKMVVEHKIDNKRFEETIRSAVRFLDNVIDRNKYSLKSIQDMTLSNRKIGLGVMGFAHMLVKMGISYNSPQAIETAEEVMKFIDDVSKDESRKVAQERGVFPNFHKSIYKNSELIRNATTTTIAPTGTIGVIASTSQGIEPIFQLITIRRVKDTIGSDLVEIDRSFKDYLGERGLYTQDIMKKIGEGIEIEDIEELDSVKDEIKRLFITAHDVSSLQHLKIQAAFQNNVDNAVSKTINMPNNATKEDVYNAYLMAHELGCKGVTIYRDGSRDKQLLTSVDKKTPVNEILKERPVLVGTTIKQATPHGKAFITLNCVQNSPLVPYEAFINIGKSGRDIPAIAEGFGRLLSTSLKSGIELDDIIDQISGISGETQTGFGTEKILSLPDAIAKGLKEAHSQLQQKFESGNGDKKEQGEEASISSGNFCQDCGSVLMFVEGCQKCGHCGYSKC